MIKPKSVWGGLLLLASLIWLAVLSFPDNRLHLIFCDVGQGDATLITQGFNQVLIDGGPNEKVLECLSKNLPFFDQTIEVIALTHPEADHLTGLISVLEKYEVDTFITGPEGNKSAGYQALRERLPSRVKNIYTGETVRIGEITLQTLWPEKQWVASKLTGCEFSNCELALVEGNVLGMSATGGLNDFSLVFLLRYRDLDVLLMGDADSRVQDEIMAINTLFPIDILKFPHHGSKTGITEEFLAKISPREAVISVGKNSFGHPTKEALNLLEKYYVKIRRTDQEGEVHYKF